MSFSVLELISAILFSIAIIHTFLAGKFENLAKKKTPGSLGYQIWHILSEVEVVFGLWAIVFLTCSFFIEGSTKTASYITSLNFTEPAFVFVIMCIAATRPVIEMAKLIINFFARFLPFSERMSFYLSALIIGPLLGSLITEPATMTVTALLLLESFFKNQMSQKFKFATLALLFVNVSVGGTLTHFAAPPVLMVASKWNWGSLYMLTHFGYKSLVAIILSTSLYVYLFREELKGKFVETEKKLDEKKSHWWMMIIHSLFLFLVVYNSHYPKIFAGVFIVFLGFFKLTRKNQDSLQIKTSFLVAFFLAGLVALGSMQAFWLRPLLSSMNDLVLFFGATSLTAITDNAALTYLGSLVDLSDASKYALVAGAVAGGGLTVNANAPNPAGFGILKESFGEEGINPLRLFLHALIPTIIVIACLLLLPSLNL